MAERRSRLKPLELILGHGMSGIDGQNLSISLGDLEADLCTLTREQFCQADRLDDVARCD